VIFEVTRNQLWHEMMPWPTRSTQLGKLTNKSAPLVGNGYTQGCRRHLSARLWQEMMPFRGQLHPGIPQCGFAAAEGPPHRPGAVDLGKDDRQLYFENSRSSGPNPHATYTMTGNGAANPGCELLEWYPRVRQIASGASNP
jgi:hypothetical protein